MAKPAKDGAHVKDGDTCAVVGGTHAGKTGVVQDKKVSKTGHTTITVMQGDGVRFKTLARNVERRPTSKRRPAEV